MRFDEFVKGQLFYGLKRLTLNNMIQDPSMVHETLTYELFRARSCPLRAPGSPTSRLNGGDYGIFLNLETLDKISLPHGSPTPSTSTRRMPPAPTSPPAAPANSKSTKAAKRTPPTWKR